MERDVFGSGVSRRSALKTIGAVGAFSLTGFTGTAAAKNQEKSYGNGNGIGAFLNEEAEYKETPIWTGEMADMRGKPLVTVDVGAMTSVDIPDPSAPPALPVAYDPLVVKVSPGATVKWVWPIGGFPIPHDVVALKEHSGSPLFTGPLHFPGDPAPEFSHTFHDRGNYLYYCTPHGAPFPVHERGDPSLPLVYNEFGMRGAVKVTGKPV